VLFSKPKKAVGLDIGSHSVKAVQMGRSGGRLCVEEVGYAYVDRNLMNSDPMMAQISAVQEALLGMNVPQSLLVAALPGQTVVIRYPRLGEGARLNMEEAVYKEAGQNIPYDLGEVSLDWTLLDEIEEGTQRQLKVLLVAAKHEVIDSRLTVLQNAELQCGLLGVDSLALADCAEACEFLRVGETVALVNIGLTSASIHFVKDGISNFIRDVSWGSRELVQAIAKERRVDFEQATKALQEEGEALEMPPEPEPEPEAEVLEEDDKPMAQPVFGDDPFGESLSGGGSLLDPLDDEPSLVKPLGGAPTATMGQKSLREILAPPLARMVSEIRRSFDYYEHQLYERPVDRIILSGGTAHLSMLRETLQDELGVESVEVADPGNSALLMGDPAAVAPLREHPAQFVVAIGLAARGMADL